jgi:hypothetical protein
MPTEDIGGVAMKFPKWYYCKPHTCLLTAYWGVTFEVLTLSSYELSPTMLPLLETFWNCCCGTAFSAVITFYFECLQYPEIFIRLRQPLLLETSRSEPNRGIEWVFHFSNGFLGQKLHDRERPVSWSTVMMENPITGPKFGPSLRIASNNLFSIST